MVNEMTHEVAEARAALLDVERRRRRVIDEIDVPPWYWWFLAGGWLLLGVLADLTPAAVSVTATVVFGAVHAAISPGVLSGQHRSRSLSVRRDLIDHRLRAYVFAAMVALVAVTIGVALVLNADGARHPSLIASAFVAVIIVIGGPRLTAAVRRRSARMS
jgi:hypothetical protein